MLHTLIIGSGFSGIGMGARLRRAGRTDFEIWERASGLGGTWRDNDYPGCACDVSSPVYSFSFAPKPDWSRLYPRQPEILDYLRTVARDEGLEPHFRFGREMRSARWTGECWRVEAADGEVAEARFLVLGTGGLSHSKLPDIPGQNDFAGATWHSAEWNHDFPFAGKRVAVIGTGASAIQFVPEIAPKVAHLSVFQRTAPWVMPKADREIGPEEAERYRRFPWMQKLLRLFLYMRSETLAPRFTHSRGLEEFEEFGRKFIAAHFADPAMRKKVTPTYRLGCKRLLISNDWYPALARDNVGLVTEPIERVTATGIRTTDGRGRLFDAVVYATGFDFGGRWKGPDIHGLGGILLRDRWASAPRAHLGVSVAGFPNLFMTMGPATGLGHNSAVYMIEAQIAHILSVMRLAERRRAAGIMPTEAAQEAFFADVQVRLAGSVWTTGGCNSWYLTGGEKNYTLWPGYSFLYRKRVRRARPRDYETTVSPLRERA
jgi:cation diffusion facilitator CzcD-associated flavoprotein CzcO